MNGTLLIWVQKRPNHDVEKCDLKAGLGFGVTTHLSRSYSWLNTANQSDTKGRKKGSHTMEPKEKERIISAK